ncbi:helix-turn-helix transcriptional regulator [Anaerobranca gottschalkii]|uniref:helix-turn-helix transcriptional regulator n=1 Tax=Anaerobranca gottschalkii TaxID=108328 RepID=UPI001FA88C22|nr:helix-turn-helix transcriptional regulator [Anaerobranca gottschalkii]
MSEISPILKAVLPIVKGLGQTLTKHHEIVLHDISKAENSIIAIENGHVTGREVGSPATDYLMELVNSKNNTEDMHVNYVTKTKDGRTLKSSTMLIRDENGKIIGALCINFDMTYADIAKKFLEEITLIEKEESKEKFPESTTEFLQTMIQNALSLVDKPVSLLTKEDKLQIVEYLNNNKIFTIKGSVDLLAKELNVSRYTIYNYLDEISINQN